MSEPHVLLFPFMSKGHTIPILHLARLLLHRGARVTLLTTTANRHFISTSLSDTTTSIVVIPFPQNIQGLLPGVESTDKLPDMSLFFHFAIATKLMQPDFEKTLESLPRISFMITDGFLGWTVDSAHKYGIPRFVFYGMSCFSMAVSRSVSHNNFSVEAGPDKTKKLIVPKFSWIKFEKEDFSPAFVDPNAKETREYEFISEQAGATSRSHGLIVNSFYELEALYCDYWNSEFKPKVWCVGPFCLAEPPRNRPENHERPAWLQWLDEKQEQGKPVLYIAFGSQAEISRDQFEEIKIGLEKSGVNFLWIVRKNENLAGDGFEDRVKERGLVVKEWVDQREALDHPSVQGFLSHCGWNSVIESICAKVPILAWPMMAEQPLNARMVVEMRVGLRVETCDGSVRGFVKSASLKKMVEELMEGEMGKEARKKVEEVGIAAMKAVEEGGSSWRSLNKLVA